MDYVPANNKPRITSMNRYIGGTRHFKLSSYVGIPTFSRKPKSTGFTASAAVHITVGLSLSIMNWCKEIAQQPWNTKSVYIPESCRYDLVYGLNEVMTWFDVNKYPDFFMLNNSNELEFNFDYKSIYQTIFIEAFRDKHIISVVPSVVEIDSQKYEGVRLFIDNKAMYGELTIKELGKLTDMIMSFNYQLEGLLNINILSTGIETKPK